MRQHCISFTLICPGPAADLNAPNSTRRMYTPHRFLCLQSNCYAGVTIHIVLSTVYTLYCIETRSHMDHHLSASFVSVCGCLNSHSTSSCHLSPRAALPRRPILECLKCVQCEEYCSMSATSERQNTINATSVTSAMSLRCAKACKTHTSHQRSTA